MKKKQKYKNYNKFMIKQIIFVKMIYKIMIKIMNKLINKIIYNN